VPGPQPGTADVAALVGSILPGKHGGNIENWRISAGATIFYPVQVDGALFFIGTPHTSRGDSEISGTAIEASLER
jgi:acetamidase/formamidase